MWVFVGVFNIEAIQGMLTHASNVKFELELHIIKASVPKFILKDLSFLEKFLHVCVCSVCEIY